MKVRLTRKQADTLLALRGALRQQTDTTCEIAAWDNSFPGTGGRLAALARKGLCTRGRLWSRRAGYQWEFTVAGRRVAEAVHLADSRARGEQRKRTGSALGTFDLSGEYES